MSQWGFYFNQDRCVGCQTCSSACKNWNEERRGDAKINVRENAEEYMSAVGEQDNGENYINPDTGANNYELFRKYYMKENWRRVSTILDGSVSESNTGIFEYNVDKRFLSISCNHCEEPACIKACPMGIITKDSETGLVLVDNSTCISCGRCQGACPWGAPQFYDSKYKEYAIDNPARPKMTKCTGCLDRIKEGLRPACVAACWNRALDFGPIEELKAKYPSALESIVDFERSGIGPNIIFKAKS